MKQRGYLRQFKKILLLMMLALAALIIGSNLWIVWSSNAYIHDDIESLPHNDVGLLLGTSRYVRGGGLNPHFTNRIGAAVRLFKAGKIDRILASGHHDNDGYDEPYRMQAALIELGVPADAIMLDLKGFRTLESIVRAHEQFGFDKFTII